VYPSITEYPEQKRMATQTKLKEKLGKYLEELKMKDQELEEMEKEKQETKRDLGDKQSELMMLKRDFEKSMRTKKDIEEKEKQIKELIDELNNMKEEKSQLEENLISERQDLTNFQKKKLEYENELNQEIENLKNKIEKERKNHDDALSKMREIVDMGENEKSELKEKVKREQKELKQLKEILQGLKNEMGSFQDVCTERNDLISKMKTKEKELLEENDQLAQDLKIEMTENKKINDQMSGQAEYIEELLKINNQFKNKNLAILLQKFLLSVEIKRLYTQAKNYKAREKSLEIQLDKTKQELAMLKSQVEPQMQKIEKHLKEHIEKKSEMNPDMLKKMDMLNECMQQLEERIISKLRDISPMMSKNNSLEQATSIRENSPFLPKKISKKHAFPHINDFEYDYQKMKRHCCSEHRDCKGCSFNNTCRGVQQWANGCSQVMLTLGNSGCASCQMGENKMMTCYTPNKNHCQQCKNFYYFFLIKSTR